MKAALDQPKPPRNASARTCGIPVVLGACRLGQRPLGGRLGRQRCAHEAEDQRRPKRPPRHSSESPRLTSCELYSLPTLVRFARLQWQLCLGSQSNSPHFSRMSALRDAANSQHVWHAWVRPREVLGG